MNHALIIYGNIASGKSTVCKYLAELLPDYNHVCLDDDRLKLWEEQPHLGAGQRDMKAQERCLTRLEGNLIYETTAVTRFYERSARKLKSQGYEFHFVHLFCPVSKCLERYNQRVQSGKIQAPFAWGKYTIEESMYYFAGMQEELPANFRINTTRVRPLDTARVLSDWVASGYKHKQVRIG